MQALSLSGSLSNASDARGWAARLTHLEGTEPRHWKAYLNNCESGKRIQLMESAADAVKLLAVVAGALHHGEKINETREKIDELICRQTGNYLPWPENRRQLVEIIHTTAWRAPFIEDTLRFKPGSVPKEVQATAKKWRASMSRRLENNEDDDEPEEAEKAALKSEVASLRRKVESLEADLAHATSVPVIDAETGAVTREPKRQRDDDVPPASGLKALKAATDATAGALAEVKHEKETLEDRLLCTICMEADAPRTVVFGPCNHFLACASCADALQECPNCRATIKTRITIANSS